jgi:hypothetical protein
MFRHAKEPDDVLGLVSILDCVMGRYTLRRLMSDFIASVSKVNDLSRHLTANQPVSLKNIGEIFPRIIL